MGDAKTLSGTIDRRKKFARQFGDIAGRWCVEAIVAIAALFGRRPRQNAGAVSPGGIRRFPRAHPVRTDAVRSLSRPFLIDLPQALASAWRSLLHPRKDALPQGHHHDPRVRFPDNRPQSIWAGPHERRSAHRVCRCPCQRLWLQHMTISSEATKSA